MLDTTLVLATSIFDSPFVVFVVIGVLLLLGAIGRFIIEHDDSGNSNRIE